MLVREDPFVDIPTSTGPMRTYIYRPAHEGRFPGVVFFSEIFQVTAPIRRTAATLAGHGYLVAVPEIFHDQLSPPGIVLAYDQAGGDRGNACKFAKPLASYDEDARATLAHLASRPDCTGALAALGICIGGHLSFRCAMQPGVRSSACFYATDIHSHSLGAGKNDDSLARVRDIHAELLMIWGRQDPHIPAEGRRAIHDALSGAGTTFTWHEFNAQHAFMRDEGHRFDPALSRLCWHLLLDLYARTLRPA